MQQIAPDTWASTTPPSAAYSLAPKYWIARSDPEVSQLSTPTHLAILQTRRDGPTDRRLKPGDRFFERPMAEAVQAGSPNPVFDAVPDLLEIDGYLVRNPSRTVLIRVKGDSMIDAGIHAGDTVIVEKRSTAAVGDIVVAIVDNEFTLKRLAREKNRFVLRPENKAYPVIRPKGDLEIFGVVVGMFRKYK